MDDSVIRAMRKWPNVPAAYGWLGLDRRGTWLLEGSPISHPGIIAFINRNYLRNPQGDWYFQNGPQQAFVRLAYAPFVVQWQSDVDPCSAGSLRTHTGLTVQQVSAASLDESGVLTLLTEHGPAVVDDRDAETAVRAFTNSYGRPLGDDQLAAQFEGLLEGQGKSPLLHFKYAAAVIPLRFIARNDVPAHYQFNIDPQPPNKNATPP
jgi:hypothetical protein